MVVPGGKADVVGLAFPPITSTVPSVMTAVNVTVPTRTTATVGELTVALNFTFLLRSRRVEQRRECRRG